MTEKLYSIKEIAALCNLSRKQLLYYEEKGLIQNVRRGANNYRYYTKEHVAKLVFMKEFREVGFSVETVDFLLKHNTTAVLKPAVSQAMAAARQELDQCVAHYQESMERYQSLLEAAYISESYLEGQAANRFAAVQVPARAVVSYQYRGRFEADPSLFYQQFSKLDSIVKEYHLTKITPKIYVFHHHFDTETETFLAENHEIQLLYGVKETQSKCPGFIEMPGFPAVHAVCVGSCYEDLKAQYYKMMAWGKAQGYHLANVSYEETLLDIGFAGYWVSKLYIPILNYESPK